MPAVLTARAGVERRGLYASAADAAARLTRLVGERHARRTGGRRLALRCVVGRLDRTVLGYEFASRLTRDDRDGREIAWTPSSAARMGLGPDGGGGSQLGERPRSDVAQVRRAMCRAL